MKRKRTAPPSIEQTLAIGLIWGHLNTRQLTDAYQLARGCGALWPDDQRFALMAAYAAVELAEPLDAAMVQAMQSTGHEAWTNLIWRRAYSPDDDDSLVSGNAVGAHE
ncbi:hypothetical protein [Actimicrobium antarcticum]